MSAHTKGPWVVEAGGPRLVNTHARVISAADGLGPVAYATGENARLIAAAPDLLNELINMTERFKAAAIQMGTNDVFAEHAVSSARAAIAKATGEAA